ncbi:hypothetical protein M0802_015878 [Mischocyttarus mexicanus]|nr:hypothetical protein M0802_015878 [Mischocyttarus mexicanus]
MSESESSSEDSQTYSAQDILLSRLRFYRPRLEKFVVWLNQFENAVSIPGITEEKKKELFFMMIPDIINDFLKCQNASIDFSQLSYENIVTIYDSELSLDSSRYSLYERKFFHRIQYETETIEEYADSLMKLLLNIRTGLYKEEDLCNKFIDGLFDEQIRAFLQCFNNQDFESTITTATHIDFEKKIRRKK